MTYTQAIDPFTQQISRKGVIRDADSAFVPNDPGNTDWNTYQKWLAGGNPPNPPAPTPPPDTVTRLQGRMALFNAGLLPQVEAAVSQAGGAVAIWYSDATEWHRSNPIFEQLATSLGLTAQQIDGLFVAAAKI